MCEVHQYSRKQHLRPDETHLVDRWTSHRVAGLIVLIVLMLGEVQTVLRAGVRVNLSVLGLAERVASVMAVAAASE